MPALFAAVIHNGELASSPAATVLRQVQALYPDVRIHEESQQEAFEAVPDLEALRAWASRQWTLERRWRSYLGRPSRVRDVLASASQRLWLSRVTHRARFRDRAWRIRNIEAAVSHKHQESWVEFKSSNFDAALIVETDATWQPQSGSGLRCVVEELAADVPCYINLAGGLNADEISISHLGASMTEFAPPGFARYRVPVTNTSCAYMINQPMAELLLDYCQTRPESLSLGIDWLVNAAFLDAKKGNRSIDCWHAEPPVLDHGSISGSTKSWHPDR